MAEFTTVVFDLDGTLVDGSADISNALNKAFASVGGPEVSAKQVAGVLGGGPRMLVERCLGDVRGRFTEDEIDGVLAEYSAHYRAHPAAETVLVGTAGDVIPNLSHSGLKLGICTNKRTAIAWDVLNAMGIGAFIDVVVGSDTAEAVKPSPLHLLQTVRALESDPASVLYVGDTAIDGRTALSAGIAYAHVAWGEDGIPAEYFIKSFEDLFAIIQNQP